ncbi:GntR family transcriptional regulator [Ancylobacter sp. MQZ15Z-1]|uniref:GntR family transcriptional regulator n=1 Tax=Ancylobacter mangrovi TaxID=2972472 RepID=A0A9X2PHL5_9HYPH|nr:FCD domain-containing protein [Ancylobacter mangrovi]MCS0494623.1 GntR family transcriptional regulator [Ancylobacter mangrovi]
MTDLPINQLEGFQPISRRQVSGEVARQIQHLIATRRMKAGDRLPTERELAAALGVGRGAVREGVKLLAGLGIVEVRQGSGTYVRESQRIVLLDPSLVGSSEGLRLLKQATAVRRLIDCAAVELAATAARPEDLAEISAYLERAESEPLRTKLAHAIDLTFEAMIGRAGGNPYLEAVQAEAHRYFRAAWEQQGFMPRPAADRSAQHWAILHALERRDPQEARARMEEHFDLQALDRDETA